MCIRDRYYTALKAADMTTLQNIMDAGSMPTEDTVSKMNGYIEDYQNISCYTMDGEKEGEYALYIAYDAKFKDVNTLAPGLTPAYVVTDSAGALRLMTVEQIQADEDVYKRQFWYSLGPVMTGSFFICGFCR